jgi:poly-gamma-glutamate capsule biosynthesis protein CapA/YwtB (metallophosphatase superfamily)
VTSVRTAGALDIAAERRMKKRIEAGKDIGPHLYLSTPYVDPDSGSPENPAGYAKAVEQLISAGIHSVKVYTHARASELAAVIQVAHRSGVRVTGHLCAVGFTQAALMGIDNLEHGLIVDSEFYSQPQPGDCPDW